MGPDRFWNINIWRKILFSWLGLYSFPTSIICRVSLHFMTPPPHSHSFFVGDGFPSLFQFIRVRFLSIMQIWRWCVNIRDGKKELFSSIKIFFCRQQLLPSGWFICRELLPRTAITALHPNTSHNFYIWPLLQGDHNEYFTTSEGRIFFSISSTNHCKNVYPQIYSANVSLKLCKILSWNLFLTIFGWEELIGHKFGTKPSRLSHFPKGRVCPLKWRSFRRNSERLLIPPSLDFLG